MLIGGEQRFHPEYSGIEKAYISLFGVPVVGLRIRARIILTLIPKNLRPSRVLDAGSGPGVITFLLARRFPHAEVLGVDCDPGAVQASKRIADGGKVPNVSFEPVNLLSLPADGDFDLVTCVDILEHVGDDAAAVASLFGATRPGGTLLLHVPALYRRYPVWRKRLNFDVPTHVRPGYEPDEIVAKVRTAGFQVLSSGYTFGFLETLANNLGYMVTRAEKRHKACYALAFPFLNLLAWFGRGARPERLGAGVYVIATKPERPMA
jgi:SAM-dependent methyltransferase